MKKREQGPLGQQTGLSVCCISRCHPILESRAKSQTKKIHVVHWATLPSWAARGGHSGEPGCWSDALAASVTSHRGWRLFKMLLPQVTEKTLPPVREGWREAQASVLTQIGLCNEETCSHLKGGCPRVEGILVMSSSEIT